MSVSPLSSGPMPPDVWTLLFTYGLTNRAKASERRTDVDITRGEQVEAELDTYIARADKRRRESQGERERVALWQESVRRHHARLLADRREAWAEYHRRQAERHRRTLSDLIAHHELSAALLEDGDEPNRKE